MWTSHQTEYKIFSCYAKGLTNPATNLTFLKTGVLICETYLTFQITVMMHANGLRRCKHHWQDYLTIRPANSAGGFPDKTDAIIKLLSGLKLSSECPQQWPKYVQSFQATNGAKYVESQLSKQTANILNILLIFPCFNKTISAQAQIPSGSYSHPLPNPTGFPWTVRCHTLKILNTTFSTM